MEITNLQLHFNLEILFRLDLINKLKGHYLDM